MAEVNPELLREAFIEPIRFALLVDDEFPSYRDLANDADAPQRARDSRVLDLLTLCRDRGWLCDVESDLDVIRESGPHLSQSDLAIVDFHLEGGDSTDATVALGLLQRLAASPHFNLAIVYTGGTVAEVALDLAFALGGGGRLPTDTAREEGDVMLLELEDHEEVAYDQSVLRAMVASDLRAQPVQRLVTRWQGLIGKPPMKAVKAQFAEYFEGRVSEAVISARPTDAKVEFDAAAEVPWVSVDNLFVAVVSKNDVPVEQVVDRLSDALVAWNPPALKVLMVHARAELEKAGSRHDLGVLHSELRQSGWLYNVFSADAADRTKRIGQLYAHLFEGMASELQKSVGEFGNQLFNSANANDALKDAKTWGRLDQEAADVLVLHAANEFLSSHACDADGRLTTGLVFKEKTKLGSRQLWVCTTPSCDLVPSQNQVGWDAQLHPYKVVYAARLDPAKTKEDFEKGVHEAHHGRHLYLTVDKEPLALEVASEESRQARLEVLFVNGQGLYKERIFEGQVVRPGKDGPELKPMKFEAVAQLRPGFANKFLMDAGMQKARIGLSWAAPMPTVEAELAADEPALAAELILVPIEMAKVAAEPVEPVVQAGPGAANADSPEASE